MSDFDGKALAALCKRHGLDPDSEEFSFVDVLEAVCVELAMASEERKRLRSLVGALMSADRDEKILIVPASEMPGRGVM